MKGAEALKDLHKIGGIMARLVERGILEVLLGVRAVIVVGGSLRERSCGSIEGVLHEFRGRSRTGLTTYMRRYNV